MATRKKKSVWSSFKKVLPKLADNLFFLKDDDGQESTQGPSWKFRRKLIYGSYRLSFAMIIFGAITYISDTAVGSGLVAGGVSLLGIILTAYTAASTYQDVKLWRPEDENPME
jgi:hypothetical protein